MTLKQYAFRSLGLGRGQGILYVSYLYIKECSCYVTNQKGTSVCYVLSHHIYLNARQL